MQSTGIGRRSVLLLGAAGAAGALTACGGGSDTPAAVPDAERLGKYPPLDAATGKGGLAWSPKGDLLAVTDIGQLALYPADLATGGGGQPIVREAHGGKEISSVAWSPDGARIVSLGHDRTFQFWTAAGEPTHSAPVSAIFTRPLVRWSPTGNLVIASGSAVVFLVDVSGATPGPPVRGKAFAHIADLTWAPDGRSYYVPHNSWVVRMPTDAAEPLATVRDSVKEITDYFQAAAVAPDGRVVVGAYRSDESNVIRVYSANLTKPGPEFEIPRGCNYTRAIRFSSDGRRVAVRFLDGPICVWEVTGVKGRLVGAYRGHSERIEGLDGLAWQPGTDRVASLDDDGSVHLWRLPA